MKADTARGSDKLMEMLGAGKPELTEASMASAFGVAREKFIIERWWWKGQPRPDIFWANIRVQPEAVGELASRFLAGGLVVEGFPLGKPGIVDAVNLNVSNLPGALR